jgi:hypothetical protein
MPLTRPRRLTSAALAARRANALKSTGPRTVRGRARVGFNALKLGQHAARSARLRERLLGAGYDRQEALYGKIRSRIAQTFGALTPEQRRWCDALATQVWCLAIRPQARNLVARTKLKTYRNQTGWSVRISAHQQIGQGANSGNSADTLESPADYSGNPENQAHSDHPAGHQDYPEVHSGPAAGNDPRSDSAPAGTPVGDRLSFGIRDPWRRIGLRFWVQRKRYWTLARMRRRLAEESGAGVPAAEAAPPSRDVLAPIANTLHSQEWLCHRGPNEGLERAVRSRVFRLAKPGWIERHRYSLTRNGEPDWEREPWKSAVALRRTAGVK